MLRVKGYDHIPAVPLPRDTVVSRPAIDAQRRRLELVRRTLAERGLVEAVTFSFISAASAELFGGAKPELRLVNPISADLDAMRPSVLPGLVEAARRNADRGFPDVALFELGPLYRTDRPDGQADVAAGLRAGRLGPRDWREPARDADLFDAKADALAALAAAGAAVDNIQSAADPPPWYHPGRAGRLRLGPLELGHFGELHPDVLEAFDAKGPIAAFEVFLDSRSSAISPLSSIATCRPKPCCARHAESTASSRQRSACSTSTRAPGSPKVRNRSRFRSPSNRRKRP